MNRINFQSLRRKLLPLPPWGDDVLLSETATAALLGINRRALLDWRQKGIGIPSEPRAAWLTRHNVRIYRYGKVKQWLTARLGSISISAEARRRIPPQPAAFPGWRTKGDDRRRAVSRKMRDFHAEMAKLGMKMEEARLARRLARMKKPERSSPL